VRAKTSTIMAVCHALSRGERSEAIATLRSKYPFRPETPTEHRFDPVQWTRVFLRDGFVDRYTGDPLVFPPVLRVLSIAMPSEFPYQKNWKTDLTHPAYWELSATVDHLIPRSRRGSGDDDNLLTTSMAHNSAKGNWSPQELGWTIHPAGRLSDWDGLISWFLGMTHDQPSLLDVKDVLSWHKAAHKLLPG
jgi:hypothetical protein